MQSLLKSEYQVTLGPHDRALQTNHYGATFLWLPAIHLPPAQNHPFFYIGIYTAITVSAALVNVTSVVVQYGGALKASRSLFQRLLTSVVRATMRWHDTTPQGERSVSVNISMFVTPETGRMLNRFSKVT